MDERKYREEQQKRDVKSLDKRVERWKKIKPAYYRMLPTLLWEYVNEADELYISGHYIGTILLCAGILELVLTDQLKTKLKLTQNEVERFRLEQMEILSNKYNLLDNNEIQQSKGLRRLRNYLIHANAGQLNKIAEKRYKEWGLEKHELDAGLFLNPPWNGGIDKEALDYLTFTRNLSMKFYGVE